MITPLMYYSLGAVVGGVIVAGGVALNETKRGGSPPARAGDVFEVERSHSMKIQFTDKHGWIDEHGVEHVESVTTGEGKITIVGGDPGVEGGRLGETHDDHDGDER